MDSWLFVYEGFDPEHEGLREALCTLGNGYFATRGAGAETQADDVHYPGTYLAGGYNRLKTKIAGRAIENEDLVNLPNWLPLKFRPKGGKWFNLRDVAILSYRQELNVKEGVLARKIRFRDTKGRETTMINQRLVHMGDPHLAAQKLELTAENWSGQIEICAALEGRVINAGVNRYKALNSKHLESLETRASGDIIHLKTHTNQSELRIALSARTMLYCGGQPVSVVPRTMEKKGYIYHLFTANLEEGKSLSAEKVVSLHTSRDKGISECSLEAEKDVQRSGSFDELLRSHKLAWKHLWERFQIELDWTSASDRDDQELILNLYTFHLLQTSSYHTMDMDVGVPSRGWHGEAYRGHIFWDELFIFPLINLRIPQITQALLMYRYRRLGEAREAARQEGYTGAMYPWQSGSDGREESQTIHLNPKSGRWIPDNSRLQRHVNAAIAYNIWNYYQVTNDMEFLSFYGAEMFLEIARFWGSIAAYNSEHDRYEILGVMGPDEYHDSYPDSERPGLDNNAYTNIMAVWVLRQALELLNLMAEDRRTELCETIGLRPEEIAKWKDIVRKMRVVFHDDGIISQFEGYDRLKEFDWEGYRKAYDDIQRLDRILEAEGDETNHYKASKQADVLMLFYLFSAETLSEIFKNLGYSLDEDTIPKNIDYYLKRTSHGSTLSRVVHSWVLARSDRLQSWELFNEALKSDVADIQGGTTPEGIHLGAMAGTVDLIQRCYTDIRAEEDVLWFNPMLPEKLTSIHLTIRYRDHTLLIKVSQNIMSIRSVKAAAKPINIGFRDRVYELQPEESKEFEL
ncbi:MAG: glycosyl hydrolase family 65 protein [Candidatus Aminicenantes bacterium]|jgi:alpha,alpha-trehalase